jgi:ubiquinone/menaquinone biosynthesis C-methylase UbiE
MEPTHRDLIIEQFTKQAVPFSEMCGRSHEEALALLVHATRASSSDSVLDVACGPGLVVLAFAAVARHATGIDLTPAMIERARALQAERQAANVEWQVGDVEHLPWADGKFSVVTCRYALHHLLHPRRVAVEMARVCAPGGRVALVDVFTTPEKRGAYDAMEKLRDPSHVRALTLDELLALAVGSGLLRPRAEFYRMELEVEALLTASFPNPGDAERVREVITGDIGRDALGVGAHRRGSEVHIAYPIALIVGERDLTCPAAAP